MREALCVMVIFGLACLLTYGDRLFDLVGGVWDERRTEPHRLYAVIGAIATGLALTCVVMNLVERFLLSKLITSDIQFFSLGWFFWINLGVGAGAMSLFIGRGLRFWLHTRLER